MNHRPTEPRLTRARAETNTSAALLVSLETWRAVALDLPLRLSAEMMCFASRRLEAQAEHLSALGRCGSVKDAVDLQSASLSRAGSDYKAETTTLSQDVQETIRAKAA
ncbi:phasin family protein [Methylobacterium nigriterrae]|uniref:phasin family protein n=1 Tax=Methylobacterium nigriterrae TaxID=3127512 RepID=UPI0030141644